MSSPVFIATQESEHTERRHAAASGALLAGSMASPAVATWAYGSLNTGPGRWILLAVILTSASLFVAGLTIVSRERLGRTLASLGILGVVGLAAKYLFTAPALALAAFLTTMAVLAALWDVAGARQERHRREYPVLAGRAHGATLTALIFWIVVGLARQDHPALELLCLTGSFFTAAVLAIGWAIFASGGLRRRAVIVLVAVPASVVVSAVLWGSWWAATSAGTIFAAAALFSIPRARTTEIELRSWWEPLLGHPARLLTGTFVLLSLAGTLLLALPQSSSSEYSVGVLNSAFTAVSAVCVTGLIVLDTPIDFSPFGQAVILLLIQVGGLGIMTFSTAVLRVLGQRMSLRHEGAAASLISTQDRGQLFGSAQRILALTFVSEAIGTVLLLVRFLAHGDSAGKALWRSVFTAVSAFCNAGFALQTDSLIPYQHDPVILHVVASLIILGGLSPVAVFAIPRLIRKPASLVSTQAKIGLAAAVILLLAGFTFILASEWNNTLADLSLADRLHNAWFQSATLRTAGFNSIDISAVTPATLSLMMLLMFIGGGAGGTAGGIKTTTTAVLWLSVMQAVRGHSGITVFQRRISERTRHRASVVVTLAIGVLFTAVVSLQLTQSLPARDAVFEVISALGTVGLSIGGTAQLDGVGMVIIIMCMFVGRVGGLTLLMFMSQRNIPVALKRPEEEIDVG